MGKAIFSMMASAFILAAGCQQIDPNEQLGSVPMDRITPDNVTSILVSVPWWTFTYEGMDYYFSFSEDGTVVSDSENNEVSMTTSYTSGWNDFHSVNISISDGGGHLSYAGLGSVLTISSCESDLVPASVGNSGETVEITLVPADESEVEALISGKQELEVAAIFRGSDIVKGIVRDGEGIFAAYYTIDFSQEPWSMRLDVISDRVLTHTNVTFTMDKDTLATFDQPVTVGSTSVSGIAFRPVEGTGYVSGSDFTVEPNKGTAAWYTGSDYRTYLMRGDGKGDACDALWKIFDNDYWSQVEISDRENRPLVFCPGSTGNGLYLMPQAVVTAVSDDVVRFSEQESGGFSYMFMGDGNLFDESVAYFESTYGDILDIWTDPDGFVVVRDGDADRIWFISPVKDYWYMGEK